MAKSGLQAGTAWADITPAAFTLMTGMGIHRAKTTGIHDRLKARALVLKSGERKIALVTADINYIDYDSITELRRMVEAHTDIKGEDVHVSSSHCHSSPGYFQLHKRMRHSSKYWSFTYEDLYAHVKSACRLIAGTVYEANGRLVDAEIGFGRGDSQYNIVRWHLTSDGKMRFTPYHRELPTNLVPLTDMLIVHVRDKATKESLAFFYTNSAHAICVCLQSTEITADYPGVVAGIIEKKFGGLCMFAPGTIGDQHPRDYDRGFAAAELMGRQLAGQIIKAQRGMKYTSRLTIRAAERDLDMAPASYQGQPLFTRTRMSAVALNGTAISFWPGEAFGMITRRLQKESPFKRTVLVSNTDDFKYYFAFEKEYGKYVWDSDGARPSIYPVAAGDQLYKAALGLLRRISG
ncbi:MAG: neutral/alkaline non-lysosomal ceramidase N-terminal domain-containing protein [Phycisphaerae bacterium]